MRQKLLLYGFICLSIFSAGCKKLVNIDNPVNVIGDDEVFKSNELANSVIAGLYAQMMSNTGKLIFSNGAGSLNGALSADEMTTYSETIDPEATKMYTNTLNAASGTSIGENLWIPAYKVIYGANIAIRGITVSTSNKLDAATRVKLIAEAKFIRAFCYFYLTNFYGDLPLVLSADFKDVVTLPRISTTLIYKQIEQDLIDAQNGLTADYTEAGNERVRANKLAATALLARVYLYEKKWADAEAQASLIIGNSKFSLVEDLDKVFLRESPEAILQFKQNVKVTPNSATLEGATFTPLFVWATLPVDEQELYLNSSEYYLLIAEYFTPALKLTPQLLNAFEPGDKRKEVWIEETPTPNEAPYSGITYYFPYKYTEHTGILTTEPLKQYYVVLRLAEQYLIRAEARANLGNISAALTDVNRLRKRARTAPTDLPDYLPGISQEACLAAIAQERQVELFAEFGHRWFDLKRTGKAISVLGKIPSKALLNQNQLLYPIPATEIISNPALLQNPGY